MLKSITPGAIIKARAKIRIFKTKLFAKWARNVRVSDQQILQAVREMEDGLIDADLGGHVFKKRIQLLRRGKRGGARTIVAYMVTEKAFFVIGFEKNDKANVNVGELRRIRALARELLSYSDEKLSALILVGELIEVKDGK